MALNKDNKDKKDNLKTALFFLQEYKNKPELSDSDGISGVEIKIHHTLHDLKKENDEATLREITDELFSLIKDHPEIMAKIGAKYFNLIR